MDYSNFSVSFPVTFLAVFFGLVAGIISLILTRRKTRRLGSLVGISSALLIGAFVLASGFIETAGTNPMLRLADQLEVPEEFEPGKAENFRGERLVRATALLPCGAVTAPCPSLHRQWSGPERLVLTRRGPGGRHSRQRLAGHAGH